MILLRAEIRTFVIYCMTEAIFCVPCISFGTSECSKRLRRESWPLPPSHHGPRAGSRLSHVGLEHLVHLFSQPQRSKFLLI